MRTAIVREVIASTTPKVDDILPHLAGSMGWMHFSMQYRRPSLNRPGRQDRVPRQRNLIPMSLFRTVNDAETKTPTEETPGDSRPTTGTDGLAGYQFRGAPLGGRPGLVRDPLRDEPRAEAALGLPRDRPGLPRRPRREHGVGGAGPEVRDRPGPPRARQRDPVPGDLVPAPRVLGPGGRARGGRHHHRHGLRTEPDARDGPPRGLDVHS